MLLRLLKIFINLILTLILFVVFYLKDKHVLKLFL